MVAHGARTAEKPSAAGGFACHQCGIEIQCGDLIVGFRKNNKANTVGLRRPPAVWPAHRPDRQLILPPVRLLRTKSGGPVLLVCDFNRPSKQIYKSDYDTSRAASRELGTLGVPREQQAARALVPGEQKHRLKGPGLTRTQFRLPN